MTGGGFQVRKSYRIELAAARTATNPENPLIQQILMLTASRRQVGTRENVGPFQSPGWQPFIPNRHSGESRNPEHSEHNDLLDSRFRGNDGVTLKRPWRE